MAMKLTQCFVMPKDAFTSETLGFLLDILGSFSNLLSFAAILWTTSEELTYALVVYAVLGTG